MSDNDTHDASHDEFHLPPNSWVPLMVSLALAFTFVGFLISPAVWIVGLVWLVASLSVWARAARREYLDLPESGGH